MTDRRLAFVLVAVVALVTLSMGACGGGTTPTAAPPVTQSPVAGPTPPTTPASLSCPLGKGTADSTCEAPASHLLRSIDAAIDQVVAAHPDYFVLGELQGQVSGQYRVRDRDRFIQGVLAILQGQGMCAFRIPESDTIQVKGSNDFSEEYELVSGRGFIHRGSSSCLRTCTPANFPLDVGEPVARVYVGIFRFRCVGGVIPPPAGENRVPLACDAVITATRPERPLVASQPERRVLGSQRRVQRHRVGRRPRPTVQPVDLSEGGGGLQHLRRGRWQADLHERPGDSLATTGSKRGGARRWSRRAGGRGPWLRLGSGLSWPGRHRDARARPRAGAASGGSRSGPPRRG